MEAGRTVIGPQKPFVDITVAGVSAGLVLGDDLKEFAYRDVHHGEVDDISFKLGDGRGLWRGNWGIDEGTEVSAIMGYGGLLGVRVPCGLYAVDETEASGGASGDTATFKALSAFTSKELRTERSEAYDEMALAGIVGKVANRHGLKLIGDIPDLSFERITQDKQSDLRFVTRLAEDWGCYVSVKGDQLVFTTRASIENADPVRVFDLVNGDPVTRYRFRKSTHKLYSKAVAKYLHPGRKITLSARAEDPRVPSGDTLKLDERVETQAHAERMCIARLAKANDDLGTGRITTIGDPLLLAGQIVELAPSYGRYAGRWLITMAQHRFNSGGYTTHISLKLAG
ncbi:phage late control D family protein [uncultured Tateyamaria sp.]|uniref:phage late control D family protein n=1 Tax=uncultured Tateyamaria sp. TaxID=455651 RepID=UPI00263937F7|nr:contractile injection system protein, VgrG/Pvc8 family [uncultured Tateyamaria sp.]